MKKHFKITILLCSSLSLLSALTCQSNNELSTELENLSSSTQRVVIGEYLLSRGENDKGDYTFNVWTNIVERKRITELVGLLSMTNKLNYVGAGFSDPVAVQIFLNTNNVPIKVVELQLSQPSRLCSVEDGTFHDGRLIGNYSRKFKFINHKYAQEVFNIARQTQDGLYALLSEPDKESIRAERKGSEHTNKVGSEPPTPNP